MASSKHLTLISIASFFLFVLSSSQQTLAETPSAPAPESSDTGLNLTAILEKGGQYTTLIKLLLKTQAATQIANQLNNSANGMTILAPTDNAFNNLPSGTINNLSDQQQVEVVQIHILPQYYSLSDFETVSNPVRTQSQYGIYITTQGSNQVNVTVGNITTQINNPLRQKSPLAVYQLDKVLVPNFAAKAPTSSPPAPSSKSNKTDGSATSSKNDNSGSGRMGVGIMGLVAGLVVLFMGA